MNNTTIYELLSHIQNELRQIIDVNVIESYPQWLNSTGFPCFIDTKAKTHFGSKQLLDWLKKFTIIDHANNNTDDNSSKRTYLQNTYTNIRNNDIVKAAVCKDKIKTTQIINDIVTLLKTNANNSQNKIQIEIDMKLINDLIHKLNIFSEKQKGSQQVEYL
jgi:hypothetical protein